MKARMAASATLLENHAVHDPVTSSTSSVRVGFSSSVCRVLCRLVARTQTLLPPTRLSRAPTSFRAHRLDGYDGTDIADVCAPRVCMMTMVRLRNLLLAYVRHRMEKIEALRWDVAGAIPDENLELLSTHEQHYAQQYNSLLSTYQMTYDLDLTRDAAPPVDNLLIKVRVLADVGKFVGPESGANIELKRGDHAF
eukprot:6196547-Pleurochrysis_carterae.AAC.6